MTDLTPKQAVFVQEYLVDMNATQAAIRAGYSEHTANEQGSQLLVKLSIAEAIADAQQARSQRTLITTDIIVAGLHKEALYAGEGSTHGARVTAWSHLAKHDGMFVERQEWSGPNGDPIPLEVIETSRDKLKAITSKITKRLTHVKSD